MQVIQSRAQRQSGTSIQTSSILLAKKIVICVSEDLVSEQAIWSIFISTLHASALRYRRKGNGWVLHPIASLGLSIVLSDDSLL